MWDSIFDLHVSVGEKVLRAVLIYLFANAVQNGIIANDISVTGAVIGAVTPWDQ